MSPRSEHSPDLPPDDSRDCAWVTEHLGVYDQWDDSLSQAEFEAIERHLHHCSSCASEYSGIRRAREAIEMAVAGLDRDAWAREKTAFAAEILAGLRDRGLFEQEEAAPPGSLPLAVPDADRPSASPRSGTHRGPGRWKRPVAMAASLLLTFALPVLAFVGVHHLRSLPAATDSHVETGDEGAATVTPAQPAGPKGENTLPRAAAVPNAGYPETAPDISETLDAVAEAAFRDFELAALLPDTEDEYEAWARKEYPHIMALYDVLTNPEGGTEEGKPLWDGIPVNIPEWGMRLYKDTPSDERPIGWRALLIYSGEIFKFDKPTDPKGRNCSPSLYAIERAAALSGFDLVISETGPYSLSAPIETDGDGGTQRFVLKTPATKAVDWEIPTQDIPESFVAAVIRDVDRTVPVLSYLALSSNLVQIKGLEDITREAVGLLSKILTSRIPECDVNTQLARFGRLLDSRQEVLNTIKIETRGTK